MKTNILNYHLVIRKEGKYYIADVPTLGLSDFGQTVSDAKKNAEGAIKCHIESLSKSNSKIPAPDRDKFYITDAKISFSRSLSFT